MQNEKGQKLYQILINYLISGRLFHFLVILKYFYNLLIHRKFGEKTKNEVMIGNHIYFCALLCPTFLVNSALYCSNNFSKVSCLMPMPR